MKNAAYLAFFIFIVVGIACLEPNFPLAVFFLTLAVFCFFIARYIDNHEDESKEQPPRPASPPPRPSKQEPPKDEEAEKKEMLLWVSLIGKIRGDAWWQLFRAKDTQIHASEEARFDYILYLGFFLYVDICNKRRNADFANAFWAWYESEAKSYFHPNELEDEDIEAFISMRISKYEQIMQSRSETKREDLFDALIQFLSKDLIEDPLTEKVAILPIEGLTKLTSEVVSLWGETIRTITPTYQKIVNSTFYVPYISDDDIEE